MCLKMGEACCSSVIILVNGKQHLRCFLAMLLLAGRRCDARKWRLALLHLPAPVSKWWGEGLKEQLVVSRQELVRNFGLPPSRTSKRSTDLTKMAATPSHNALLHLLQTRHSHARTHAGPTRLMMLCERHCRHQSLCSADSAGLTRKGTDAAFCRSKYESTTCLVLGQAESCCSRTEPPESVVVKSYSCIAPQTALNTACGFVEM